MLFILSMIGAAAFCQTPRVEIGVQLSGLKENVLREYPLGGGGRITVHAFRLVDAEAEVNRYPIGGADSLFPVTQMTFGARLGQRFGPLGIYGKVKPGFVRFDKNLYVPNMGTHTALEIGAVLEFYSRHHFAARMDFGDTAVFYGSGISIPSISAPGPATVPGTRHQLQWSIGVSAWF